MIVRHQATHHDLPRIYEIYRSALRPSVEREFGQWDDQAERERFDRVAEPECHQLIEVDGNIVGYVAVKVMEGRLRLLRLMILPQFQNRGIGSHILTDLIEQSRAAGMPIELRVIRHSPARHLYERHGFYVIQEQEHHVKMEQL